MHKRQIALLGSTGSIGTQALDVVRDNTDRFEIYALVARQNVDLLAQQAREFRPEVVVIADEQYYAPLKEALADLPMKVWAGADAIATMLTAFYASRALLVSTPLPVLIDGFVRLCSPLRFVGLSPERLGLLIALMVRSIPALMDRWGALRRAAVARNLPKRMYWRLLIPWVVQAVDYATATARALRARHVDELK